MEGFSVLYPPRSGLPSLLIAVSLLIKSARNAPSAAGMNEDIVEFS